MIDKVVTGFFFVASLFLFAAHVDASTAEGVSTDSNVAEIRR